MSFISDFRKLLQATHEGRLKAAKQGALSGSIVGAIIGFFLERYINLPIKGVVILSTAALGGFLNSVFQRQSVINNHLSHHAQEYDPRLVAFLQEGKEPQFKVAEENEIVQEALHTSTIGYDHQYELTLFKTINPTISHRLEVAEQRIPRGSRSHHSQRHQM